MGVNLDFYGAATSCETFFSMQEDTQGQVIAQGAASICASAAEVAATTSSGGSLNAETSSASTGALASGTSAPTAAATSLGNGLSLFRIEVCQDMTW
jgi:hypothetical protein